MKITFLLPGPASVPVGGYRVVFSYANFLVSEGHDVTICHAGRLGQFTPPVPPPPAWIRRLWRTWLRHRPRFFPPRINWYNLNPHINMIYLPGEPLNRFMPKSDIIVATAWTTAEYVRDYDPDKGVPFYLIQHWESWQGFEDRVAKTWHFPFYKVVVSRWLKDIAEKLAVGPVEYIPNGIDMDLFTTDDQSLNREPSIVSMYHPAPWKGSRDVLQALESVHTQYPDIPAAFFGVHSRPHDLPDWITYWKNPQQTSLAQLYQSHAIFVSGSWAEGFALPPAEAMASGCVFVGTDSGGCRDYAVHGQTALLSPPRDPDALAANLRLILEDRQLYLRLQQNGLKKIREFTWNRAHQHLLRYFHQVLEGRLDT